MVNLSNKICVINTDTIGRSTINVVFSLNNLTQKSQYVKALFFLSNSFFMRYDYYMHVLRRIIILIVLFLYLPIVIECSSNNSDVSRIRDGKILSLQELKEDIKDAPIIIIGEIHNNKAHHDFQLRLIEALHDDHIPIAIGLEMFKSGSQKKLDGWVKGTLSLQEFLEAYYDDWGFPWPLYKDIFIHARDNKIPLVGLNVSRAITQKIAQNGFSSLTKAELKQLPPGITCDITPAYREFINKAYRGHGFVNEKLFIQFCEAQMVWDSTMAWNIMKYLKQNPERVMVVLAGAGHAWKLGIPSNLDRDPAFSYKVILPEKSGSIDREDITLKETDYLLLENHAS
jgi:uncharacterized iron-regulated protein